LIFLLILTALILRLAPLGRYVTPDEPAWVHRAVQFADGLAARDWAAIPSTGHPGVTTMWLGTAGVAVQRWLAPAESDAHLDWLRQLAWLDPDNDAAFHHLASFLPWGRAAVAVVTSLGLLLLYWLVARLCSPAVALTAVGLLACDPFLVGHSGLLHTDGLLTTFAALALTSGLNGLRERNRPAWWALAGLFTGLALLTKSPALILLPFIFLLIALANLRPLSTHSLLTAAAHAALFALPAAVTCLALYPAFWGDPIGTVGDLFAFSGRHIEMAQRSIFFAGQMTYAPGWAFYPVALLFRISPIGLVGTVIGLVAWRRQSSHHRLVIGLLLSFVLAFGLLMSLGAKKHDRYLLPVIPPLTLIAALSLPRLDHWRAYIPIALQFALVLPFAAYPLTGFNLLAGGPWIAARVISTDWGEGMGAAARQLNRRPDADRLTVAASSVPTFASLFQGRTLPLDRATQADYLVTNRPTDDPAVSPLYHSATPPTYYIYTNTLPLDHAAYLADHTAPNELILLDAPTPLLHRYTGPAALLSAAEWPDAPTVAARLTELDHPPSTLWHIADPSASPITAAHLRQVLETNATLVSTTTLDAAGTLLYRYADLRSPPQQPSSRAVAFGSQILLVASLLPQADLNAPFPVHLRWQTPTGPTSSPLHATLQLRDQAAHLWAEVGQWVLNDHTFPTTVWRAGEWADNRLTLTPPDRIPPDRYTVELVLTDQAGAQMGAWDAQGQFQGVRVQLGAVQIVSPNTPAEPPGCDPAHRLTGGPFQVCTSEITARAIPSGDILLLPLTWSAGAPPQANYRVRWRLVDSAGAVALEETAPLSPHPTSQWRANDSFEARYDLRIDPTLPAGGYTLVLNLLTPTDHPLWAEDHPLVAVEVLARARQFELPPDIDYPLDLVLGGHDEKQAIYLRQFDMPCTQATPGDALPITLYWQASGPTDVSYAVFVHLVGPDGQNHGQADHIPDEGTAPTTSWAPAQVIADTAFLPVDLDAPPGDYRIAIGMYDPISGGRLPITTSSGQHLPDDRAFLPIQVTILEAGP